MKKRIISLLLCLVLIVSLMPAAAAASTSDSKTVTVRYASGHGVNTHDYAAAFTYSDELFTKSGYTHRQDLAEMSLGLAFAAFSSKDSQYSDNYATGNRNFVSMAKQCGFENIQSNKWMFQPAETDSIGINCASKTIRRPIHPHRRRRARQQLPRRVGRQRPARRHGRAQGLCPRP